MRHIGTLSTEDEAQQFSAFLYGESLDHAVEPTDEGWELWVRHDDDVEASTAWLAKFRASPSDEVFVKAREAATIRVSEQAQKKKKHARAVRKASQASQWQWFHRSPLTWILIGLSVVVSVYTKFGTDLPALKHFLITTLSSDSSDGMSLLEIRRGEWWRLLTPMFIHFGPLHLFFNLWWLRDLGSAVERSIGKRKLLALVVVIGLLSHPAQFMVSGPRFGGMSGVVFGLLAYAWVRGKYDLTSGLFVPPRTMMLMLLWFLLCFTGQVGPIANVVHGVGLATGAVAGYIASRRAV